jgi:hypothetical protein
MRISSFSIADCDLLFWISCLFFSKSLSVLSHFGGGGLEYVFHFLQKPIVFTGANVDSVWALANVILMREGHRAFFQSDELNPEQKVSNDTKLGAIKVTPKHEMHPIVISFALDLNA